MRAAIYQQSACFLEVMCGDSLLLSLRIVQHAEMNFASVLSLIECVEIALRQPTSAQNEAASRSSVVRPMAAIVGLVST